MKLMRLTLFFLLAKCGIAFVDPTMTEVSCSPNEFACEDGTLCIPQSWKCDLIPDCHDNSDEPPDCSSMKKCHAFTCHESGRCIPLGSLCDGYYDCGAGDDSDESIDVCPPSNICPPNSFRCGDALTCDRISSLCDEKSHCPDKSKFGSFCNRTDECKALNCSHGCRPYRTGPLCFCPEGKQPNGTQCVDFDECQWDGYCDQLCYNGDGSYSCGCVEGYSLVGNSTCVAINVPENEPSKIIYGSRTQLEILFLNGTQVPGNTLVEVHDLVGMDCIQRNNTVCWINATSTASHFSCANISDLDNLWVYTPPQDYPLMNAHHMAYDWVSGNWYILDSRKEMFLCNQNISICVNFVPTLHYKPKGIALDPRKGLLFLSSWEAGKAKIERARMDLEETVTIVDKIGYPIGLAIDYPNEYLYWVDGYYRTIERVDYNGNTRRTIARMSTEERPSGITLLEKYLYITSWNNMTIKRISKQQFNQPEEILFLKPDLPDPLYLHLLHRQRQPTVDHPCANKNGGCDHLCIPLWRNDTPVAKCLCKTGYALDQNGTCVAKGFCGEDKFRCGSECIDLGWLCDGDADCFDFSDESPENCVCKTPDKFRCETGRCISKSWVCDHHYDCGYDDHSDETDCDDNVCDMEGYFTCGDGSCIPISYVCDSDSDCPDGTDELFCNEFCNSAFSSADQISPYCILSCKNTTDRLLCEQLNGCFVCPNDPLGSTCISEVNFCDNHTDCPNGTDELQCSNRVGFMCKEDEFSCADYEECVPKLLVCDGNADCPDKSDEQGCGLNCSVNHWKCNTGDECIFNFWRCDGDFDCKDDSDEKDCPEVIERCFRPNILCDNDTKCIGLEDICNSVADCNDGLDEGNRCDDDCDDMACEGQCVHSPTGSICTCPEGKVLSEDGVSCSPTHPCQKWDTCSQTCVPIEDSYKCACFREYQLETDGFTCKSTEPGIPYLLFSNRHELRRISLNSNPSSNKALISKLKNTIGLDFYHSNEGDFVFWTDVIDDKIYKGLLIDGILTNIVVVLQAGLSTAEGLAVDWVGKNLYWVESNLNQIEVAKLNGSYRRTLIASNMDSPRAIALDPGVSLLFWTDWEQNNARIESASMAGEGRTVVMNVSSIRGGGWPNGLTLDYNLKRIYWVDAKSHSIHCAKYDGSDMKEILRSHMQLSHAFAISLYENNVYWTDWRTNSVCSANKFNGTQVRTLQQTITQPFDIKILHASRQPKRHDNPCEENNGGCSHLCLLSFNGSYECNCPHIMSLGNDSKTCFQKEKVLLFARENEIRGVDLAKTNFDIIPRISSRSLEPKQIAFKSDERMIYWIDSKLSEVHRVNLSGQEKEIVVDTAIYSPVGFAIDWLSNNMFIGSSSETNKQISVATLNGEFLMPLNLGEIAQLESLAIDPIEGKIFWSDVGSPVQKIEMATMLGTDRKVLTSQDKNEDLLYPSSLVFDCHLRRLYWANKGKNSIQYYDFSRKEVFRLLVEGDPIQPEAIALYRHYVYFSNQADNSITKVHKSTGSEREVVMENIVGIYALTIYDEELQVGSNVCSQDDQRCSHLCLPVNATMRKCLCAVGFQVDEHNPNSCIGEDGVLIYSTNVGLNGISILKKDSNTEEESLPPISQVGVASRLDFHAKKDLLIWVDHNLGKITKIQRSGTDRQVLFKDAELIDGIAVDWVADNIYWSNPYADVIEMCRLNASERYIIIADGLEKPGALAVFPSLGYLFWADNGSPTRIERSALDGTNRFVVLDKSLVHISDLSIDYHDEMLYFVDQADGVVERIALNGSNRFELPLEGNELPVSIFVYLDSIFLVDMLDQGGSVKEINKTSMTVKSLKNISGSSLMSIIIMSNKTQTGTNPCHFDNGGCQEICLFNGTRANCHCYHGKLALNGLNCTDYSAFLMYSRITSIESLHMFDEKNPNLPHKSITSQYMKNAISLTFDFLQKKLFYSDIQHGSINSVFFNGSDHEILVERQGFVEGIAFEEVERKLYWTCKNDASINQLSIEPKGDAVLKIVKLQTEDKPRGIAVDGCGGRIYWTNWNTKHPSIQRCSKDGTVVDSIISSKIRMPNGLVIDHQAQKLYWGDARLDKIERCNLDGTDRVVMLNDYPNHPFDLAIYGDYIFWTDWGLNAVVRANKYTGRDVVKLKSGVTRLMGIVAVANDTNACYSCKVSNGGCEHKCSQDEKGKVICSCNPGSSLQPDGKHCAPEIWCFSTEFRCELVPFCIPYILTCDGVKECPDGSDEGDYYCSHRKCREGYFNCGNGQCILEAHVCDRKTDCFNLADEKQNCSCTEDEFLCGSSSECIPLESRCDHEPDCRDASDEIGCERTNCTSFLNFYSEGIQLINCANTTNCIHQNWVCDGANDCWDNSDESNCTLEEPKCPHETHHECRNGNCVAVAFRCDGDDDCKDGNETHLSSDEMDCPHLCPRDQFRCNSTKECIYKYWLCDGKKDCTDGSDEPDNCSTIVCDEDEYKCRTSGRCIPATWKCDGNYDCVETDDEDPPGGCPLPPGITSTTVCGDDHFLCALYYLNEYKCIPKNFVCDGSVDCADGTDEDAEYCATHTCNEDQFNCTNHECIPLTFMCNGERDCEDGSDEENCIGSHVGLTINSKECGSNKIKCHSDICIDVQKLCNGENDCGDWSDEKLCMINECLKKDPPVCEHECKDQPTGYTCHCREGYKLNTSDNSSCDDIDECEETFPCSHYCYNTIGSYKCECAHGYLAEDHGRKCKNKKRPNLIISIRFFIQEIDYLGDFNSTMLVENLTNVVALDYDWSTQCIYWSDVTHLSAYIKGLCKGEEVKIIHSMVQSPDGIAVDWVAKNLYWCDKGKDTIEVSGINGTFRKVLINDGLEDPRAIVLDPIHGYMYWTDWGNHPHIGKAGMDGSDQRIIINSNISWPNALTISYVTNEIFWADARFDYIGRADLDGKNHKIVLSHGTAPNFVQHIFAMSVFEEWLYWTDWEFKSVMRAHKYTGANAKKIYSSIHRPMDIHVFHPDRQPPVENNPCENGGGCGSICLLAPEGKRTCACPNHYILKPDGVSCMPNCSLSQFICNSTYKCIPFFWKCDTVDDCGDGSDEPDECPVFNCNPGQFQCGNGSCIHPSQICDGIVNCKDDASDEQKCDHYACMQSQFKCKPSSERSGFCIPKAYKCDGIAHCPGGEDEKDCLPHSCASDSFQCNNTQCIPSVWVCDEDQDCMDGSDEMKNCTFRQCLEDEFKCKNGRCIPNSWKCDGQHDCFDKEDETDCENTQDCEIPSYFRCKNNMCIPEKWRCDYDNDCSDGFDEEGCDRDCVDGEFSCDGHKCIKDEQRCDGMFNCDDRTDEMNCTINCTENQFMCVTNKTCILKEWRCDADADCGDESDEKDCKEPCPINQSKCKNSNHCIPDTWLCDGYLDCTDGSDEEKSFCQSHQCLPNLFRCNNSVCLLRNKLCNGYDECGDNSDESNSTCHKHCRPDLFECRNGHCIANSSVCDGYDDCTDNSDELDCPGPCRFGTCSQICILMKNDTRCSCAHGYTLHSWSHKRQKSCFADGELAYIIVANDNHLRKVFPNKHGNTAGIQTLTDEGADDVRLESIDILFDDDDPLIFWTNHHNGTIASLPLSLADESDRGRTKRGAHNRHKVIMSGLHEPRGLSVDWATKIIYFVDSHDRTVCALSLDGKKKVTLFGTDTDAPFDIVVDPFSAQLFVSIWGNPRIEVARTNGNSQKILVKDSMSWPAGLAIDYPARRLYWADSKMQTIESVKLDGTDRQVLKDFLQGSEKPSRIDVFEDFIYVTTSMSNTIYRMSKFIEQRDSRMKIAQYRVKISDVVVVQEQKQSPHAINPCLNNSCDPTSLCLMSGPNTYSCHCPDGLKRKYTPDGRFHCFEEMVCNLTCNVGQCVLTGNGPRCKCPPMFKGPQCNIYRCSGYCKHGRCMSDPTTENAGGEPSLKCICPPTYTGKQCETSLPECPNNGTFCLNDALCIQLSSRGKTFQGCICQPPFRGPRCEQCESLTCNNGGICTLDKSDSKLKCSCPRYYEGVTCETSICDQQCRNGHCINVNGTLTCRCFPGWSGDDCATCISGCEDPCKGFLCYNGGKCKPSWTPTPHAECICPPNYIGDRCLYSKCDGYCENGICEIVRGVPNCKCDGGWTGLNCSHNICEENDIKCQRCHSLPCMNEGQCFTNTKDLTDFCKCKPGFHGLKCEINACDGFCQNGGTCRIKGKEPTCTCKVGFSGDKCAIDDCAYHCIHGQCRIQNEMVTCECEAGYTGATCDTGIEVLPCSSSPCQNHGTCFNIRGKAVCRCPLKYQGLHCQYMAVATQNPCKYLNCSTPGGICQTHRGVAKCVCLDNWTGEQCESKSDCRADPCLNGGTCVTVPGSSSTTCLCSRQYEGIMCQNKILTEAPEETSKVESKVNGTFITLAILISLISIIAIAMVFMVYYKKKRTNNHTRLKENGSTVELTNPVYLNPLDHEEDSDAVFTLNNSPETNNFKNPIYNIIYEGEPSSSHEEKANLLESDPLGAMEASTNVPPKSTLGSHSKA